MLKRGSVKDGQHVYMYKQMENFRREMETVNRS